MGALFVANIAHGCRLRVEDSGTAFWTMLITGPDKAQVKFSNVYGSVDQSLQDAETFGRYVLTRWGIPSYRTFQWQRLAMDSIPPDAAKFSSAKA